MPLHSKQTFICCTCERHFMNTLEIYKVHFETAVLHFPLTPITRRCLSFISVYTTKKPSLGLTPCRMYRHAIEHNHDFFVLLFPKEMWRCTLKPEMLYYQRNCPLLILNEPYFSVKRKCLQYFISFIFYFFIFTGSVHVILLCNV